MPFVGHDNSHPCIGLGFGNPLPDKCGSTTGRAHENAVLPEQTMRGVECRECAYPVNFVYQLVADICRQNAVSKTPKRSFSKRLSKQDAAMCVDRDNPEMREDRSQKRAGTAKRTASSYASDQAVYLAHCAHKKIGQSGVGQPVSITVILPCPKGFRLAVQYAAQIIEPASLVAVASGIVECNDLGAQALKSCLILGIHQA